MCGYLGDNPRLFAIYTQFIHKIMHLTQKKVVMIGGGTGSFTVLSGLKLFRDLDLTAIVTMSDNGGSTGKLRDELGVLPPGDARQCLVALSESPEIMRQLFTYRFDSGELSGHNFGNLFLSALEKITGNFEEALETASHVLSIRGQVLPVTTNNVNLKAVLSDGTVVEGEDRIGDTDLGTNPVKELSLFPQPKLNDAARTAILEADLVVIGPGNLYCSLLPALIVPGMKEALQETSARVVYNVNLMAKFEHCPNWSVERFIQEVQHELGASTIDVALYNTRQPEAELVQKYAHEGAPVLREGNSLSLGKTRLIGTDLLAEEIFVNTNKKDPLVRTLIRHDSMKIARALYQLI